MKSVLGFVSRWGPPGVPIALGILTFAAGLHDGEVSAINRKLVLGSFLVSLGLFLHYAREARELHPHGGSFWNWSNLGLAGILGILTAALGYWLWSIIGG